MTDISFNTDTTTINNNLTLSTGKLLNIEGYSNVKSHLDYIYFNIDHIVNETTYTGIYNDFKIEDGYKLSIPNYSNVETTLTSLTNSINSINSILSTSLVPIATIISSMATTAPSGYLALNGQLVLIASYASLYAIVGTVWNALYSAGVPTGYFYLADTKGAFLRGVGTNGMTTYSHCQGSYEGGFQIDLVKQHAHNYTASTGTQGVSAGGSTARNNDSETWKTSTELFNSSNVAFGHTENRVFNMAVNYYIKY